MMNSLRSPLIREITLVLVLKVLALVTIKLAFFSTSTSAPANNHQVANVLFYYQIPAKTYNYFPQID